MDTSELPEIDLADPVEPPGMTSRQRLALYALVAPIGLAVGVAIATAFGPLPSFDPLREAVHGPTAGPVVPGAPALATPPPLTPSPATTTSAGPATTAPVVPVLTIPALTTGGPREPLPTTTAPGPATTPSPTPSGGQGGGSGVPTAATPTPSPVGEEPGDPSGVPSGSPSGAPGDPPSQDGGGVAVTVELD